MEQESIYRSVYDDINRNVVLNDVYSKINDEIMYKTYFNTKANCL